MIGLLAWEPPYAAGAALKRQKDKKKKKFINNKCWRKENSPPLLVGMEISTTTMKNTMKFPQKTKIRTITYDPAIPLLGIHTHTHTHTLSLSLSLYIYIYIYMYLFFFRATLPAYGGSQARG